MFKFQLLPEGSRQFLGAQEAENISDLLGRISTFEKLRAQQKAPNSQAPSSKEAPSSKLKN